MNFEEMFNIAIGKIDDARAEVLLLSMAVDKAFNDKNNLLELREWVDLKLAEMEEVDQNNRELLAMENQSLKFNNTLNKR